MVFLKVLFQDHCISFLKAYITELNSATSRSTVHHFSDDTNLHNIGKAP